MYIMSQEPSMKVLICNFESLQTPSGVASFAIKLLRHLPFLEALTTRNAFKTPLEKRETNLEARTRCNEICWMKFSKFTLMNRKIRESDLIHLNPFNFTELLLLLLVKIHRKKCIATMHSNINSHFLTSIIALEMARLIIVYNVMLLMVDRIVFLSQAHYENYRKYSLMKNCFRKKAVIIPNAIESERILTEKKPAAKIPLTCIFVGRFERRKGIYDLLALAEQLQEEEIRFLVVGFGPLQLQIPLKNVKIVGKVENENLFNFYDKSHVFLMPSYSEAFGITILEAMSRGLVILASDIPGMREKIVGERNGYLFPLGDTGKIKERLLFLKDNPQEIIRISRNNLEDVQRFTLEKQANKYVDVYRDVLRHDQNSL
jgi:glycosyltransferase involved in cell wall biosynthesis